MRTIRNLALAMLALGSAALFACDVPITDAPTTLEPEVLAAKGGKSAEGGGRKTGGSLVADVVSGDLALTDTDAPALASSCTITDTGQWHVNAGHTGCLIVTLDGYELTDDVRLIVTKEKGKNGRITHVKLLGQDVIGDAGIQHETDNLAVAVPVTPDKNGFTLHVHAVNADVWRLSGHTGGERVAVAGRVSIGDVIYRTQ